MILDETLLIALDSVKANKLRSILTLTGISIGVFSIIAVMTAIQVLQSSVEAGLTQLGGNTFQIQKFPNGPGSREDRDRFKNRRNITYDQALQVKEKASLPMYVGIEDWNFGEVMKSDFDQTKPNVQIAGGDYGFFPNNGYDVVNGRSITEDDVNFERNVIVVGQDVSKKIFPNMNPVGQTMQFHGFKFEVVGVLEIKGSSFGQSQDNIVIIPLTTFFKMYGKQREDIHITVMAKSADLVEATQDEVSQILRSARKVPAGEENDFYVYSNDSVIDSFNSFTAAFKIAAAVISFIALFAAGIGIMNIMLVSVTERTKEIGIRKAIGAPKQSILVQFVSEAIILCQLGGFLGILLGAIVGNVVALLLDIQPVFPWIWATIGVVVCSIVGVVFGAYPAYKAANLDPIEALRYE